MVDEVLFLIVVGEKMVHGGKLKVLSFESVAMKYSVIA